MKQLIFHAYPATMRNGIVNFSSIYKRMIDETKKKLIGQTTISLHLGRITDAGVSISPSVNYFDVVETGNMIKAKYYGDHHGNNDEKIPIEKTIRFDNPFGEIPVLPGYEQLSKFFLIGDDMESYRVFINEAREILSQEIGSKVQLRYKNDDRTFSVIEGFIKEVNKGNIFMEDYHEILVKDNKSVKVDLLQKRNKNHRFISEKGYLCWICPAFFNEEDKYDEGEVFGEKEVWNFETQQLV